MYLMGALATEGVAKGAVQAVVLVGGAKVGALGEEREVALAE